MCFRSQHPLLIFLNFLLYLSRNGFFTLGGKPLASILIIDDEDLFRSMLKNMLETEGYDVLEASDGGQGVQIFGETHPDLVITDIVMPDQEGIQTILEIRQKDNRVPIIAVSGSGQLGSTDYLVAAEALGAIRTFSKPFEREEMISAIREVLNAHS
jgi:DNA-binding response OmpR family regulator